MLSHDNTLKVYEYPSLYAHQAYAVKSLELVLCSYFLPDMNAPYFILTSINRSIQSYYMIFSPNSTILQINPKNHFLQGPMSWEVAHIFRSPTVHIVRGPWLMLKDHILFKICIIQSLFKNKPMQVYQSISLLF